jgi:hypothetical protein
MSRVACEERRRALTASQNAFAGEPEVQDSLEKQREKSCR